MATPTGERADRRVGRARRGGIGEMAVKVLMGRELREMKMCGG